MMIKFINNIIEQSRGKKREKKTSGEFLHVNILHHVSLLKNKSETQITYGAINTFG